MAEVERVKKTALLIIKRDHLMTREPNHKKP